LALLAVFLDVREKRHSGGDQMLLCSSFGSTSSSLDLEGGGKTFWQKTAKLSGKGQMSLFAAG
jgi:hypothetical protein